MTFEEKQMYALGKLRELEAFDLYKYELYEDFIKIIVKENTISHADFVHIQEPLEKKEFIIVATNIATKKQEIAITPSGLEWLEEREKLKSEIRTKYILHSFAIVTGSYYVLLLIEKILSLLRCCHH